MLQSETKQQIEYIQIHVFFFFLLEVEDVVNTVVFLLSDKSAITTGQHIVLDGGLSTSWDRSPEHQSMIHRESFD